MYHSTIAVKIDHQRSCTARKSNRESVGDGEKRKDEEDSENNGDKKKVVDGNTT